MMALWLLSALVMGDESCASDSGDSSLAMAKSDFETKGYAYLPNLLTAEEVDKARALVP